MMRTSLATFFGIAVALAVLRVNAATPAADLILTHAHIRTPGGWVEALAVRDGVIVAVGRSSAVSALRAEKTRVIDLAGKTVLPGLHDMHVHPLTAALAVTRSCFIPPGATQDVVVATVRQCAAARKPGEWIVGGAVAPEGPPLTRRALDSATPDNPTVLQQQGGHAVYANTRALALAGVDRTTANPENGEIVRDATGEPTGLLLEMAQMLVGRLVPPPSRADNAKALEWGLDQLLALGVTSFTDAAALADTLLAYDDLDDVGKLKQRARACIAWVPPSITVPTAVDPISGASQYARPRLAPTCVKFLLDGIPGSGRTAALLDPYEPAPGRPANERGQLNIPVDVLSREVTRFDRAGLTAKFHAGGDAAAHEALDAVEAARKANGMRGPRHEIAHTSLISPADIARAKSLGVTLEFSPVFFGVPAVSPDQIELLITTGGTGRQRMDRAFPVKEALDAGVLAVGGTDWPTTPPNPWPAIESLVTRWMPPFPGMTASPVEGDPPLQARERISLEQAVALYTSAPARQLGLSNKLGSLDRGYWADLIVLDRDPFAIPITQVHDIKTLMTIINGEIVYEASNNQPIGSTPK